MVGSALLAELATTSHEVIACDVLAPDSLPDNARFYPMDVTTDAPVRVIARFQPDVIVHLAALVTAPEGGRRTCDHAVEVEGTRAVVTAALAAGTKRVVITSSGAAYGYHADNPVPLREADDIRGNKELSYADHKRLVEEFLAEARENAPQLEQVVLRVSTVLDCCTENRVTNLFRRSRLLAVQGTESPFVFVWNRDLARILHRAATNGPTGIFNVAGDGVVDMDDLADMLNKPVLRLPAWTWRIAFRLGRLLRLSPYGPEHVRFMQYRPVLSNRALKDDFGYTPEKSSREVFEFWQRSQSI
jgi:UDP-glucose 4-epimerase